MGLSTDQIPADAIPVLDHGFVRLDGHMADDLSVANAARVSFARRKLELDEADEGLIRFLMRDRHGSTFEHNAFRYHIRCPIFVAREWFRHRIGCLTGDTEVTFVDINGHAHMRKTIDELVDTWNNGRRDGRRRIRRMRVRVLDENTREFTHGHIYDIIDKGVQPVYRLSLEDGKQLTVTENHRLLTADGWRPMRQAVQLAGDFDDAVPTAECHLMVNGVPVHQDESWLRTRRRAGLSVREIADEAGCSYHTVRKWLKRHDLSSAPSDRSHTPRNTGRRGCRTSLRHSPEHLEAIRRARSGSASNFWRDGASPDRATLAAWTTLNALKVPSRRGFKLTAHPVRVIAVQYVGLRQTYDLSIEGAWHNFVANGVVVHNSFNEFSLRYARATDDFYVPAAEDVRTQVGKPGAYSFEPVEPELAERTREELQAVYDQAYATYERLVEAGVARELARSALPVGAYTQFYWTVNARALMNFLSLRNSEFAQLEIRRYAEAVEAPFAELMPVTHAAFVANGRTAP